MPLPSAEKAYCEEVIAAFDLLFPDGARRRIVYSVLLVFLDLLDGHPVRLRDVKEFQALFAQALDEAES